MSEAPLLAVIYVRVSTEEQAKSGYSIQEQLRACRDRVRSLELQTGRRIEAVEFVDEMSGELLERPGLQRALELVRNHSVAYFVCLDPDRLARKLMVQLLVTDEIERTGCKLEFVSHDYVNSPEGRLFYQLRGAISEFERAKILERMLRGKRGKLASGGMPGHAEPFGYRTITGQKHATADQVIVPDPEESKWVLAMYRWCAEEWIGPVQIAKRLTELGVPTKTGRRTVWDPTVVRRILRNPVYATGELVYGKRDTRGIFPLTKLPPEERKRKGIKLTPKRRSPEEVWGKVHVQPIVPKDLWDKVQLILDSFRIGRRAEDPRKNIKMLTGLGRCGICGTYLVYYSGSKIACASLYHYYQWRKPGQRKCTLPQKKRTMVEEAVWQVVKQWLLHPETMREAVRSALEEAGSSALDEAKAIEEEIAGIESRLKAKREEQHRIGLLFAQGLWPQDVAVPELERLSREVQALEQRLRELRERAPNTNIQHTENPLEHLLQDPEWLDRIRAKIDELTYQERTELVRMVVDHFVLYPTPRGEPAKVVVYPRLQPPSQYPQGL